MITTREETYTTNHTRTIYTTSDGKEFQYKQWAQEHEAELQRDNRYIKYESVYTFENEDIAGLYYIDSLDNFKYMTETAWFDCKPSAYEGPGWYLHIGHDGGDSNDWNEVYYLPSYLKEMEKWIEDVKHLTSS